MNIASQHATRLAATLAAGVVSLALTPAQAFAVTYTVYWDTGSSTYAYGYAYTDTKCTSGAKRLDNSHTSGTGRRSIKSSTVTDFTWGGTRPYTDRLPFNKCYKLPDSGLWFGYDPAR